MELSGLFTDFYELTMAQGYFLTRRNRPAVFDMFFRSSPFGGGFTVFAGLEPLLRTLEGLQFSAEDIAYLESLRIFRKEFLEYLRNFRFRGDLYAPDEGTLVFAGEPVIRVHGDIIETQLIESLLLNCINFQSLIATKSARIFLASGMGKVLEFGLRRAQGPDGALSAARAAFIGGAAATSNTAAARALGIPAKGTMAHSWIMSFQTELEAFQEYADMYPDNAVFLIDTYGTLESGIGNAIEAGKKVKAMGGNFGVRLDSGDLLTLSREVRRRLDDAGFPEAAITASNDLDEMEIERLVTAGAPIDFWGVGTRLVTGDDTPALTGVYKLSAYKDAGIWQPVMKLSETEEKSTNPGIKQVYRLFDGNRSPLRDVIALDDEAFHTDSHTGDCIPLLTKKMERGGIYGKLPPLPRIRENTINGLKSADPDLLHLRTRKKYPVVLSQKLERKKSGLREI